jgi:protein-L-isoaspartate(D-aspartate) O-methyltransferase
MNCSSRTCQVRRHRHVDHLGDLIAGLAAPVVSASAPTLEAVTTHTTIASPQQLRAHLVETITARGTFRTPAVEAAFRAVPRHVFLPGVSLEEAYSPHPVITKRAEDGSALSSASQPNLVAAMLEQLDVRPGMRVLEIGAATGINAALLAELVAPLGQVTTIEIDDDLADGARSALAAAGYPHVRVICGDGAAGDLAGAPYDRITVTAGAGDLAPAWWTQLAVGGRIVVPLVLHASGLTRSIAFDRTHSDQMGSVSALVCGFVPMRGALERAQHTIALADDLTLRLDARIPAEEDALRHAFAEPDEAHWTGITIVRGQPTEHLDLWLASTGAAFARLATGPTARQSGVANPTPRWAGAALYDGGSIAYLTLRVLDENTEELGLVAHGSDRHKLTAQLLEHLHQWDRDRPDQPTITAYPAGTPDEQLRPGYRIDHADSRLIVQW